MLDSLPQYWHDSLHAFTKTDCCLVRLTAFCWQHIAVRLAARAEHLRSGQLVSVTQTVKGLATPKS